MAEILRQDLFKTLIEKATLKQNVYKNTLEGFSLFKEAIKNISTDFYKSNTENRKIVFEYTFQNEFEIELKFAGDILLFVMHTNIFEFGRDHEIWRGNYLRDDKNRSYCGIINIYNFLADSFKYNRYNDVGYLIGRIFINNEMNYFIEGKREIGLLFRNFGTAVMNQDAAISIVQSAILYTINFDLLTPNYDSVKEVRVSDMKATLDSMPLSTGKRLGFRFQADKDLDNTL